MSPTPKDQPTLGGLPSDLQDAVALVQKQLKARISDRDARVSALGAEAKRRKVIAIVLKVVSVLSGIVVATGFAATSIMQVLGGLIPAIAALERVFANLNRLLAVTAAKNAYERIRRQTVAAHDREIVSVVKIRDRDPQAAADKLISFVGELRNRLSETCDAIETTLAKNDYDRLGTLALEQEQQGT